MNKQKIVVECPYCKSKIDIYEVGKKEATASFRRMLDERIEYLKKLTKVNLQDENTLNQLYARINELKELRQKLEEK